MNVVNLLIIISILILLPSSIGDTAKCPADDIVGCSCYSNRIHCRRDYTGDDIPIFRRYNEVYDEVSY